MTSSSRTQAHTFIERCLRYLCVTSLLFITACGVEEPRPSYTPEERRTDFPYYSDDSRQGKSGFRSMPWEVWSPGKDLTGQAILDFAILKGDEKAKSGDRQAALDEYTKIDKNRLSAYEKEALALRIASMQLSLRRPREALDTVSNYFTSRSLGPDAVTPEFGLVLAFSYGHSNNLPQSLAWFSRVNSMSPPNSSYSQVARSGAKSFLRAVPIDQFETTASAWERDQFVRTLVAEERQTRSTLGTQYAGTTAPPINEIDITGQGALMPHNVPVSVGLLLPMSGRFGTLGKSTANGIELAFANAAVELGRSAGVNFATRDTTGDPFMTVTQGRELYTTVRPAVVLGPLLSDPASAITDIARESGVPTILFSKKNIFPTGGGVFRLGATADSQVDSLLSAARGTLGLSRFGLIYPSDPNGLEFATSFRLKAAEAGGEILFERMYNKDDPSQMLLIAQELERYKVQAVFFPDSLLMASRFATSLSARFRQETRLLGTASWDDPVQLARFQTSLDNSIFVSPFFTKSERPAIRQFIESYKSRYNQEPDFLAAQGFDAATMALAAMKRSLTGVPFAQALAELGQYEGLTGRIAVSSSGEMQRSFALAEFKNGAVREIVPGGTPSYVYRGDMPVNSGDINVRVGGPAAPGSY
ncbi:MAG: penicillin-binding protein activator [Deltaproteobacteria bacterium]|nr:penicillin-binding protein activator [Deltaproteobacteria bacterium]